MPDTTRRLVVARPTSAHAAVVALDVAAKVALVLLLALVLIDPTWGNLEKKAPVARALTYPMLAFAVPLVWLLRRRAGQFPWLADLLVTLPAFSDILGNRLDLYDSVAWFDDWMHFMNAGLLSAAFLLLTRREDDRPRELVQGALAFGVTVSLLWELFEYVSFVTRSAEYASAYSDTLGDLTLGWVGAVVAGVLIARTGWR